MSGAKPGEWTKTWIVKVVEWDGGIQREPQFYGPFTVDERDAFLGEVRTHEGFEAEHWELQEAIEFHEE